MSKWNDVTQWSDLLSGVGCPICSTDSPRDIVAELECSWVTVGADSPVAGYACLVFKRHAVELHELTILEGAAYMRDIQKLSAAVARVTHAVKINYEIHGNSIPHLHMHFFPRYRGDAFENRPIDPKSVVRPVYGPGQLEEFRGQLVAALTIDSSNHRSRKQ
jgi:diadenosine tetraphosphate (Ap4A) HIT family hydrolase